MRRAYPGLALAVAVALPALPAAAATPCAEALAVLDRRMEADGFWFGGYRASHNWTGVPMPLGSEPNVGARNGLLQLGGPEAAGIAPVLPGGEPERRSPFAGLDWRLAPAHALRTLLGAAQILAQSGREEPCLAVLAEAERDYADYLARLREVGLEPYELRSWRQKQLVMAQPVTDPYRPLPVAALDGMELRNLADERLGEAVGAVMDRRGREPAFVVIARRRFLGFGRDEVLVPWGALRVTPGGDVLVLDIDRGVFGAAPRIERGAAAGEHADAVGKFWDWRTQLHAAGRGR